MLSSSPKAPDAPPVLRLIDLEMARLTCYTASTPTSGSTAPATPSSSDTEEEGGCWGQQQEAVPSSPRRCVVGGKPSYCSPEVRASAWLWPVCM